jgi:hypothetical protein
MAAVLKRPELSENDIRHACLDLLSSRNWKYHRMFCGPFWTYSKTQVLNGEPTGTPDYVCLHARYPAFYLETKRPRKELSREQVATRRVLELGYRLTVLKIDDPHELRLYLDRLEGRLS